jgi:hypothetical protein
MSIVLPDGTPHQPRQPTNEAAYFEALASLLESRIGELERELYGPDARWEQLHGGGDQFTRQSIQEVANLAEVMYLKNPIIQRGINIKTYYTFGQGVQVSAPNAEINDVVQSFWKDERNQSELTRTQAMMGKDVDLQVSGNLFFVLFTNQRSGSVRVRSVPLAEIQEIVCNPDDAKEPWFYLRRWTQTGAQGGHRAAYYPDWRYTPRRKPDAYNGVSIEWDAPIYHVKVGGMSWWQFGLSTVYAQIDWARAYKVFLESIHSYTQAVSRIAVKVTTGGGAGGVAKAKSKLASTIGSHDRRETNPATATGSAFIRATQDADYEPLNIRGLSVAPEDGRRFLLMVAAAAGIPEVFYGDADVGNHATAKSLDRPTELMMRNRQEMWRNVLQDILGYVVKQAVMSPRGALAGMADVEREPDEADPGQDTITLDWNTNPDTGDPYDSSIVIDFPEIINIDVRSRVEAITMAHQSQTVSARTVARLLLVALGVEDVDKELDAMYPEDWQPGDFGDGVPQEIHEIVEAIQQQVKQP